MVEQNLREVKSDALVLGYVYRTAKRIQSRKDRE
jgi:hypothetical protein